MSAASRLAIGVVGGGQGGSALLDLLLDWPAARVVVVIDSREDAPALTHARALGIPTSAHHLESSRIPSTSCSRSRGAPRS